jgi:nucleoside-diphosphate-sugar epimerase
MMHTILGAGGTVANALTRELNSKNEMVRLVSRKPVTSLNANTSWRKADLLSYEEVLAAAKGSTVIYVCAGLVYDVRIWREQWPVIMQNVINVAKETGARLIFFDNVYMYGLVEGPMTEETPYNPSSKKGEVRANIATRLMDEAKAGNISASIARAADFYGTDTGNSFMDMMLLSKYAKKEKAQWIGNPDKLHNFTYIPDAGRGMFLLGQNPDTDNQIWHMPTALPITGSEMIGLAASIYHVQPNFMAVNKLMMRLFGLFNQPAAGAVEMYYQYSHDYDFNSAKFEKHFSFTPAGYADGIRQLSETLYKG